MQIVSDSPANSFAGSEFGPDVAERGQSPVRLIVVHCENYISFFIEWDMIVVTVLLSILNQMEFNLVQIRKENCRHDHIPFNLKGNGNPVFWSRGI